MHLRAVSVLILTIGCAGRTWTVRETEGGEEETELGELQERAAFDFSCSKLRFQKFDDRSIGVEGCGKRGTYIRTCHGNSWNRECTWILNGVIESTKWKPESKSEPHPESSSLRRSRRLTQVCSRK